MFNSLDNEEIAEIIQYADNRLGSTAEQRARTLSTLGIKGVQMNTLKCPLARFYKLLSPDIEFVVTHRTGMLIRLPKGDVTFAIGSHNPSRTLSQTHFDFMRAFDTGKYPELINSRAK